MRKFNTRSLNKGNAMMTPGEEARQEIDRLLEIAGWHVQDYKELNLGTSLGVAI
jgi:type I restriction enzyme, R subunit